MIYSGFIIITFLMIWLSKKVRNTWINAFSVLASPYVFIVVFNKLYGERHGFYPITDTALAVIFCGLFVFFCGTTMVAIFHADIYRTWNQDNCRERLREYRINAIVIYSLVVITIGFIKILRIYLSLGLSGLTQEGALVSGLFGHLLFSIYPLQPILLLAWLKNKNKKWCVITVILTTILLFGSFVKYHVICYFVMMYLFLVLNEKKYLKKATLFLLGIVAAIFVANYVVDFISQNILNRVSNNFYIDHLWKYVAGAVINGDAYYRGAMGANASVGYKVLSFLFAFPNMFISALTGSKVFPFIGGEMIPVSNVGEESNVVDAISYMFSDLGNIPEIIFALIYFFIFGIIMEVLFVNSIKRQKSIHISVSTIFAFFVFFSFFGTFYINSMPWEIAIYSVIIPLLFNKKISYKLGPK